MLLLLRWWWFARVAAAVCGAAAGEWSSDQRRGRGRTTGQDKGTHARLFGLQHNQHAVQHASIRMRLCVVCKSNRSLSMAHPLAPSRLGPLDRPNGRTITHAALTHRHNTCFIAIHTIHRDCNMIPAVCGQFVCTRKRDLQPPLPPPCALLRSSLSRSVPTALAPLTATRACMSCASLTVVHAVSAPRARCRGLAPQ